MATAGAVAMNVVTANGAVVAMAVVTATTTDFHPRAPLPGALVLP
jgi:hypothetical protein